VNEPVDWELAERIAVRVASRTSVPRPDLTALQHDLEAHARTAEPLVEACTGLRSANGPARVEVVDRAGWAKVNVAGFRQLLAPVAEHWAERIAKASPGARRAAVSVTRRVAGVELGTLLGWLSRRVLGQYDLLVTAEGGAGRGDTVYLVGPNLLGLEHRFGFPPDQFRLWVVLHELTHRAQFTGVPWMRQHYLSLVRDALSIAELDPAHLLGVLRSAVQDREATRARLAEGGLAALVASPGQRAALNQISGVMALLEGHGDVTMTRAGSDLLPDAGRFERVLSARRQQANPVARTVQRLLGLEAKLNQYAAGERFLAAIEAVGGPRAVDRCWQRPENLPTLEEIREPDHWLSRMGLTARVA
jgi:coenzyme F420 biosynthesis associated uncharacterized protein